MPCSPCTAKRACGGISGPPQDRARCKHGPQISIRLYVTSSCTPGCMHQSQTPSNMQHATLREQGLSCTGRTSEGVLSFYKKSLKLGVLQHVCKGKEEKERVGKSPNPAPKLLLGFTVSRAAGAAPAALPSLAPTAGGTLPALRLPSLCLSLCPFCLLAVSLGWTISSKLIATALGSVLKSMVPIRAWPGCRSSRGAAAAPAASSRVYFPPLEKRARSPPSRSTGGLALPAAP